MFWATLALKLETLRDISSESSDRRRTLRD
jgi:hypothetical protein